MSNHKEDFFTDEQLIKLAGKAAFARGKKYFQEERVISLQFNKGNISACVEGNHNYRVNLTHRKNRLEGGCECPASEGFDFCKHCVATAMAYREKLLDQIELEDGDSEQRIKAYLNKLNQDELVNHLLRLITNDSSLEYQWSMKADIALNKMDEKEIKKRITKAIPYNRHYYRYGQVQDFFNNIEPIVELLESQLKNIPPEKALKLIDYALQRLDKALETIDDSGGYRFDVTNSLFEMHRNSLIRINWDKKKLVNYLITINSTPYTELYPEIPFAYKDLLGEEGMDLIFERFQTEWDKLPNLSPDAGWEERSQYNHLEYLLLKRAEDKGGWQEIIKIMQKTSIDQHDFLKIFQICLENDDLKQAELWLQKAKNAQENQHLSTDYSMQKAEIQLLEKRSDFSTAAKMQYEYYINSLQLESYKYLMSLASMHNQEKKYCKQVTSFLQSMLNEKDNKGHEPHYTNALTEVYLLEDEPQKALELIQKHVVNPSLLYKVTTCFIEQPTIAMPLYKRLAEFNVKAGNNDAYHHAVSLLQECATTIKNAAHQHQFDSIINELLNCYKAKRNFVKFTKEAFGIS